MQYRPLGDTGLEVSALGIGTMRFKGEENACEIIQAALRRGLSYIDCGAAYSFKDDDTNAEAWVGKAIAGHKRAKMVISAKAQPRPKTKDEPRIDRGLGVHTRDQMWGCIEAGLRRVGVDYFDLYQFWDMSAPAHFRAACVGKNSPLVALKEAQEQGLVKHLGFTTHGDPGFIIECLQRVPEFRAITVYYNFTNRYVEEAMVYAGEHHVGITIMGPLYGGILAGKSEAFADDVPELKDMPVHEIAFRFLYANPTISTVLSGMNDPEHLKENAGIASDRKGLTPGQCERFVKAVQDFTSEELLCSGCRYCDNACPQELPIYQLMNTYQLHQIFGLPAGEAQLEKLKRNGKPDPSLCSACGQCTDKCPQSLPVAERMERLAELLAAM